MEWYVYREDVNRKVIEPWDIFRHGSFNQEVKELLKECDDKEKFEEKFRRILQYYFRSKCEHELIFSAWPPTKDGKENIKVDIYSQVWMNKDVFMDYVWSFKK